MPPPIYQESHLRSILKGVSWRIIGTGVLVLGAWLYTGDVTLAFSFGAFEFVTKLVLYYAHERLWQLVPRGTVRRIVRPDAPKDPLNPNV